MALEHKTKANRKDVKQINYLELTEWRKFLQEKRNGKINLFFVNFNASFSNIILEYTINWKSYFLIQINKCVQSRDMNFIMEIIEFN